MPRQDSPCRSRRAAAEKVTTRHSQTAREAISLEEAQPDVLAEGLADQLNRPIDYRPGERDRAARAAAGIASLR